MRRCLKLALALAVAAVAAPALAAPSPVNVSFTVSATVARSCTATTTNVVLGEYDPLSTVDLAPTSAPGAVSVTCSKGTQFTVKALTSGARNMHSAATGDNLSYRLYKDAGHTQEWTTDEVRTATTRSTAISLSAYGVVAAGQDVGQATDYTDTVNVQITF